MLFLEQCQFVELLPFIRLVKNGIIPLIQIGIPIILIVLGMFDLGKAVVASKEDGKREDVLDFEMKEHRIWKAELIEGSSKMYGSVCVPVTPVFIRSVEGSFSYRKDKIKADSISFIYTDGVRFDLPLDEVEILSDDQTELSSGNTVRISWQDHEFVVTI